MLRVQQKGAGRFSPPSLGMKILLHLTSKPSKGEPGVKGQKEASLV